MSRFNSLSVAVFLVFSGMYLSGCAGGPTPDAASLASAPLPKSHARLKIHRESNLMGMALDVRVKVDGREIGSLSNGETRIFTVPSGKHQIAVEHWSHPGTSRLDLNAQAGMLYQIEVEVREDAAAAGLAFGIVSTAIESAANDDNGYWSIRITGERPVS